MNKIPVVSALVSFFPQRVTENISRVCNTFYKDIGLNKDKMSIESDDFYKFYKEAIGDISELRPLVTEKVKKISSSVRAPKTSDFTALRNTISSITTSRTFGKVVEGVSVVINKVVTNGKELGNKTIPVIGSVVGAAGGRAFRVGGFAIGASIEIFKIIKFGVGMAGDQMVPLHAGARNVVVYSYSGAKNTISDKWAGKKYVAQRSRNELLRTFYPPKPVRAIPRDPNLAIDTLLPVLKETIVNKIVADSIVRDPNEESCFPDIHALIEPDDPFADPLSLSAAIIRKLEELNPAGVSIFRKLSVRIRCAILPFFVNFYATGVFKQLKRDLDLFMAKSADDKMKGFCRLFLNPVKDHLKKSPIEVPQATLINNLVKAVIKKYAPAVALRQYLNAKITWRNVPFVLKLPYHVVRTPLLIVIAAFVGIPQGILNYFIQLVTRIGAKVAGASSQVAKGVDWVASPDFQNKLDSMLQELFTQTNLYKEGEREPRLGGVHPIPFSDEHQEILKTTLHQLLLSIFPAPKDDLDKNIQTFDNRLIEALSPSLSKELLKLFTDRFEETPKEIWKILDDVFKALTKPSEKGLSLNGALVSSSLKDELHDLVGPEIARAIDKALQFTQKTQAALQSKINSVADRIHDLVRDCNSVDPEVIETIPQQWGELRLSLQLLTSELIKSNISEAMDLSRKIAEQFDAIAEWDLVVPNNDVTTALARLHVSLDAFEFSTTLFSMGSSSFKHLVVAGIGMLTPLPWYAFIPVPLSLLSSLVSLNGESLRVKTGGTTLSPKITNRVMHYVDCLEKFKSDGSHWRDISLRVMNAYLKMPAQA